MLGFLRVKWGFGLYAQLGPHQLALNKKKAAGMNQAAL
jgi:hypothetical protein